MAKFHIYSKDTEEGLLAHDTWEATGAKQAIELLTAGELSKGTMIDLPNNVATYTSSDWIIVASEDPSVGAAEFVRLLLDKQDSER